MPEDAAVEPQLPVRKPEMVLATSEESYYDLEPISDEFDLDGVRRTRSYAAGITPSGAAVENLEIKFQPVTKNLFSEFRVAQVLLSSSGYGVLARPIIYVVFRVPLTNRNRRLRASTLASLIGQAWQVILAPKHRSLRARGRTRSTQLPKWTMPSTFRLSEDLVGVEVIAERPEVKAEVEAEDPALSRGE